MANTKPKVSAIIASVEVEADTDVAKPGPKPQYGETREHRRIRTTEGCWNWCKTFRDDQDPRNGGAGYILESIYQSDKRKAFEDWFKREIESQ